MENNLLSTNASSGIYLLIYLFIFSHEVTPDGVAVFPINCSCFDISLGIEDTSAPFFNQSGKKSKQCHRCPNYKFCGVLCTEDKETQAHVYFGTRKSG